MTHHAQEEPGLSCPSILPRLRPRQLSFSSVWMLPLQGHFHKADRQKDTKAQTDGVADGVRAVQAGAGTSDGVNHLKPCRSQTQDAG